MATDREPAPPEDLSELTRTVGELARRVTALGQLTQRTYDLDALIRSVAGGVQRELEGVKSSQKRLESRYDDAGGASPAPAPRAAAQGWVQYATAQHWDDLAGWVNWLSATYDFQPSHTVRPCWPAHLGVAEELAALRTAWIEAALIGAGAKPSSALIVWHDRWLHPCLSRMRAVFQTRSCEDQHKAVRPGPPTDAHLLDAARRNAPSLPAAGGQITAALTPASARKVPG